MSETLGDLLASTRRSRGRSIADIEDATRIRAKMIDALEKGDYDTLPAPAYVRGYIISYAKYLDLDAAPLLQLFAEETGHVTARDIMKELPADEVVPSRAQAQAMPVRTLAIIIGSLILVVVAVWAVGRAASGPEQPAPLPPVPEPTSTVESENETDPAPAIVTTETPEIEAEELPSVAESFALRVEVAADGASWLRITVDGLTAYEGILTGGEDKSFDVSDSATVRIGKPSSVTVYRDDVPVTIPTGAETPEVTLSVGDDTP